MDTSVKDVTVNGDDLLKILTAAAENKIVDQDIIDRLTSDYNHAGRKPRPAEPTGTQFVEMLRRFVSGRVVSAFVTVDPKYVREWRSLLSDGWIEFGVNRGERIWTTSGQKERWEDTAPICRLTSAGMYFVKKHLDEMASARAAAREAATGVKSHLVITR